MANPNQFKVDLDEISYTGQNIGRDLIINITVDTFKKPIILKKRLAIGKVAKGLKKHIVVGTSSKSIETVNLGVKVVEKDKISNTGAGKGVLNIDMNKAGEQVILVEVAVNAIGGDQGKQATFLLKFIAQVILPVVVKGTITVNANSKSNSKAGVNAAGVAATPAAVKADKAHIARYDGPTVFKAVYEIVTVDGKLDTIASKVKFITVTYTDAGVVTKSGFTTTDIPFTSVKFVGGDVTKVESFTCSGNSWYPATAPMGAQLIKQVLKGKVDLKNGKGSYDARYTGINDGVISIYKVTGVFKGTKAPANPKAPVGAFAPGKK